MSFLDDLFGNSKKKEKRERAAQAAAAQAEAAQQARAQEQLRQLLARKQAQIVAALRDVQTEAAGVAQAATRIRALMGEALMGDLAAPVDSQLAEWEAVVEEVTIGLREIDQASDDPALLDQYMAEATEGLRAMRAVRSKAAGLRAQLDAELTKRRAADARLSQLQRRQVDLVQQEAFAARAVSDQQEYASLKAATKARRAQLVAAETYAAQVDAERQALARAKFQLELERQTAALRRQAGL